MKEIAGNIQLNRSSDVDILFVTLDYSHRHQKYNLFKKKSNSFLDYQINSKVLNTENNLLD